MKPGALILFFLYTLFSINGVFSQPGGGGGLQIMKIHDPEGNLLAKDDSSLKISYYILSGKKGNKVKKELFNADRALGYRYPEETYTHIYLPPYIKRKSKNVHTPDQRLQIIYNNDTMIIDLIGIKAENAGGNTDRMDKIEFTPGYFKCFRDPQKSLPLFWNNPDLTQKQKEEIYSLLRQGLDVSSIYQLKNIGMLEYIPPRTSRVLRPRIRKRVECIDSLYPDNGYMRLCPGNIKTKDSTIDISVRAPYVIQDTVSCYKFFYYFIFDNWQLRIDKEYQDAYSVIKMIQTGNLTINGRPLSGCLKLATMVKNVGISSRYSVYNILVLYYNDGKIIRQAYLQDVDLKTEEVLERPTS